jgi:integrase
MARSRRSKGTGSVFQDSQGRWVGMVDLGYRNGKRWRPKVVCATEREARQRVARMAADRDAGKAPPGRELTGPFLTRWLETVQQLHLAASTYVSQEMIVRVHLTPAFGRKQLAKLTPADVQQYVADKAKVLAPGTVRLHIAVLNAALSTAVDWGLIPRSPASRVRLPKAAEREYRVFTWEETERFLRAVASERLAALYILGIATGMRIGECLGLQWSAVDIDAGILHVERKLLHLQRGVIEDAPKTARGRRDVELVPWAVAALRRHKARQAEERLLLGEAWERPDLVFTSPLGKRLWDRPISSVALPRLLAQAGLPRLTFHGLRHSLATILLSEGADVAAVSAMLGHSDASITLRVYRHVLPGEQRRVVNRLERLVPDEDAEDG